MFEWLNNTSSVRYLISSVPHHESLFDFAIPKLIRNASYTDDAIVLLITILLLAAVFGVQRKWRSRSQTKSTGEKLAPKQEKLVGGEFIDGLPIFSIDDVKEHDRDKPRMWSTYKRGVYDITDFAPVHPGGKIILRAAGGPMDKFWKIYTIHYEPHVTKVLEGLRIGNLQEHETKEIEAESDVSLSSEPKRSGHLEVLTQSPYNAQAPLDELRKQFLTPKDLFYVRNHMQVPVVDPAAYELKVCGTGIQEKSFSLEDLKKFPKRKVVCTIMCSGNRRGEMGKLKKVEAVNWSAGAAGTAEWAGAGLFELLESLGFEAKSTKALHVQFEGLDTNFDNVSYGASVTLRTALASEPVIAYEMNGEPIPPDHGFPVRAVIPGVAGVRNVKWLDIGEAEIYERVYNRMSEPFWGFVCFTCCDDTLLPYLLGKIILSEEESAKHWQKTEYKGFSPNVSLNTADWSSSPPVVDMPVTSAICNLKNGEKVKLVDGKLVIQGYAWSGGGRNIIRVDVTADRGKTWQVAKLHDRNPADTTRPAWAWTFWTAEVPVKAEENDEVEIWSRALDESYNSQPETVEKIWNVRGVTNNAYFKVLVNIEK